MNTLDSIIESFAAGEVDGSAVREAQRKLEAAIAQRLTDKGASQAPRKTRWFAAIASAIAPCAWTRACMPCFSLHSTSGRKKLSKTSSERVR